MYYIYVNTLVYCDQWSTQHATLTKAPVLVPPFEGDQAIIQAVQNAIKVQDLDFENNQPGEVLKPYLIAGATLDPRVKAKIWSHQFVELANMVPKNQAPPGLNIHSEAGASSQFSITSARARQPSDIQEWHSWFIIYAAVYTQKYPHEAPALFTYIDRIFGLKTTYPNKFIWREYDLQFRRTRAFVQLPWHIQELHILTGLDSNVKSKNNNNSNKNRSDSSAGGQRSEKTCYDYNKPSGCHRTPCPYAHRCAGCRTKGHPKFRCHKAKSDTKQK